MNIKQMKKFIKIRNASGFNNNFQFSVDMEEAGIKVEELERCTNLNNRIGCWWDTPVGVLVELYGKLKLYPHGTIVDMSTGLPFEPQQEEKP